MYLMKKKQTTVDWSTQLAGKIKKEKLVNHLLRDEIKGTFHDVLSRIYAIDQVQY